MAVMVTYNGVPVGDVVTTVSDNTSGTFNIDWSKVRFDSRTGYATTTGFERMAHPMTADEIIDQAARELARKRPAD